MPCFVPFNNRNLDVTLFVSRPTVVLVDEIVKSLKQLCLCTETLGCVKSSIFKSIHGNLIIWYGGWMKKSTENKEHLTTTLLSTLTSMSSMAVLIEHSFFDAYAGESKDGSNAAKFSTGDMVSMNVISSSSSDLNEVSYANLALFKSRFLKMEGATAGACLKCQSMPLRMEISCYVIHGSLTRTTGKQCCPTFIVFPSVSTLTSSESSMLAVKMYRTIRCDVNNFVTYTNRGI